jgi:hypothetical protein
MRSGYRRKSFRRLVEKVGNSAASVRKELGIFGRSARE